LAPSYELWLNDLSLIPAVSSATQTFCLVAPCAAGVTATDAASEAATTATVNKNDYFKITPKD
jgi:hypothetical protein